MSGDSQTITIPYRGISKNLIYPSWNFCHIIFPNTFVLAVQLNQKTEIRVPFYMYFYMFLWLTCSFLKQPLLERIVSLTGCTFIYLSHLLFLANKPIQCLSENYFMLCPRSNDSWALVQEINPKKQCKMNSILSPRSWFTFHVAVIFTMHTNIFWCKGDMCLHTYREMW